MRDWTQHDGYLTKLAGEIYRQPEDEGHSKLAYKVIDTWMSRLTACKSVLDLGCGEAFCQPMFEDTWGVKYEGITLGDDYLFSKDTGRNVKKMDFSFLEYEDESFDLLFSRHSLEHSPFPLLTLMEWRRVSKQWLGVVVPAAEWYGYIGRNHYYVLHQEQWVNLLDKAGWKVIWNEVDSLPRDDKKTESNPDGMLPHEYWLFCEKKR
jgi:SAM-dependent methyltransferase